jgi:muconolactone delta-isomerase
MAKFLILARPRKPIPEKANVEGARAHWRALRDAGKAEVYEIVEDNGAGFAVFLDVDDHDELMAILFRNPLGSWGEYQVLPLGTLEGETQAMRAAGIIR